MSRETRRPDEPGWLKMVVGLAVVLAVIFGGTGHAASRPAPQSITGCVQLGALPVS